MYVYGIRRCIPRISVLCNENLYLMPSGISVFWVLIMNTVEKETVKWSWTIPYSNVKWSNILVSFWSYTNNALSIFDLQDGLDPIALSGR